MECVEMLLDWMEKNPDGGELAAPLGEVANCMGFHSFLYAWDRIAIPGVGLREMPGYVTNFPKTWMERYKKRAYYRYDHMLQLCLVGFMPVIWGESGQTPISRREKRIIQEAATHGLISGISIPVHGPRGQFGLFCLASDQNQDGNKKNYDTIFASVMRLHTPLLERLTKSSEFGTGCRLKPVEKECLLWAARGKTSTEIVDIIGVTERVVYYHMGNAVQKLGAVNRTQAVAIAVSLGFVNL
jgi:DNA-binding CsgD family transcriptional regulator